MIHVYNDFINVNEQQHNFDFIYNCLLYIYVTPLPELRD